MKILLILLAFTTGGFMLVDGLHIIIKGRYIGPPKPGPWAEIFYKFNVDVFKLGPLFVVYGIVWLALVFGVLTHQTWAYALGILVSVLTLWYLPVGTLFSVIVLILLLAFRSKLGI